MISPEPLTTDDIIEDVWKLSVQVANERRRRELEPVIKITSSELNRKRPYQINDTAFLNSIGIFYLCSFINLLTVVLSPTVALMK